MSELPVFFVAVVDKLLQGNMSGRTGKRMLILVAGAIMAKGRRTVASVLSVMGLSQCGQFGAYHRVLSRCVWSPHKLSQALLRALVEVFAPTGMIVVGIDDTIERRWGKRISARGIYRDPVRSSRGHFVKTSGLRWLSCMLLSPVGWANRVWALPFLSVLCPSRDYNESRHRRHKRLSDWARQMLLQVSRWLKGRTLVVVADSGFAVLELLCALRARMCIITRLRLDAALYEPAAARVPGQRGRPRCKGARLPSLKDVLNDPRTPWQSAQVNWYNQGLRPVEWVSATAVWYHPGTPAVALRWLLVRDPSPAHRFDTQALLCTNPDFAPLQILQTFMLRWQVEVTFEEARAHLGIQTQRQWSDLAIARTTPALLALFSIVTLLAHHGLNAQRMPVRTTAWYTSKALPTFSDTLAWVRHQLWLCGHSCTSPPGPDNVNIPRTLFERLTQSACSSP